MKYLIHFRNGTSTQIQADQYEYIEGGPVVLVRFTNHGECVADINFWEVTVIHTFR